MLSEWLRVDCLLMMSFRLQSHQQMPSIAKPGICAMRKGLSMDLIGISRSFLLVWRFKVFKIHRLRMRCFS
jgi:hypothetical protein